MKGWVFMLKQYKKDGFTIVELLVVIVIIGILAALALNTFGSAPARARDVNRQTDVESVATQLEAYYVDNNSYPTETEMTTDPATTASLFEGVSVDAVTDQDGDTFVAGTAVTNDTEYAYDALPSGCDNGAAGDCEEFLLTAFQEEADSNVTIESLNKVPTP